MKSLARTASRLRVVRAQVTYPSTPLLFRHCEPYWTPMVFRFRQAMRVPRHQHLAISDSASSTVGNRQPGGPVSGTQFQCSICGPATGQWLS